MNLKSYFRYSDLKNDDQDHLPEKMIPITISTEPLDSIPGIGKIEVSLQSYVLRLVTYSYERVSYISLLKIRTLSIKNES